MRARQPTIAFIGSAGIPNRYGGFEAFLEHCTPELARNGVRVLVTCDAQLYPDRELWLGSVRRLFLRTPANGAWSVLHDLFAFFRVFWASRYIVVLGVSGGLWFPLFRLLCSLTGKHLCVNIDGIEWRRSKFSPLRRAVLKVLDALAQQFAHTVIIDSEGLRPFLFPRISGKTSCIAYSGDHVIRHHHISPNPEQALTICRIEPENNLEMLIDGFLQSKMAQYTIIGNWQHSNYSQELRQRFSGEPRLRLLDPIYDAQLLAQHREASGVYLHGHSVGGTNPSLVEMLFYDSKLLCFDVSFNRFTAGACASYFSNAAQLANCLDLAPREQENSRASYREQYSARHIATAYLQAVGFPLVTQGRSLA